MLDCARFLICVVYGWCICCRLQDQYDTIDLSDNEIKRVENFPRLKRLRNLVLNNNFVTRINPDMGDQLIELEAIILTNNKIASLTEVDSLARLPKLTVVSLLDNPVVKVKHYRLYTIHKLPNLKVLDFIKVTHEVSGVEGAQAT